MNSKELDVRCRKLAREEIKVLSEE